MKCLGTFLAAALLVGAANAACFRATNHDVFFERGSALLRPSEIKRLAEWNAGNAIRFPQQELLMIVGNAEAGERNASRLSIRRARVVADYFRRTGYRATELTIKTLVYDEPPGRFSEGFQRTELAMVPTCTN